MREQEKGKGFGRYHAGQQLRIARGEFRGKVLEVSEHSYPGARGGEWQIVLRVPGGKDWGRYSESEVAEYCEAVEELVKGKGFGRGPVPAGRARVLPAADGRVLDCRIEAGLQPEGKEAPPKLDEVARQMREVHAEAVRALGPSLGGGSIRDLMLDRFPVLDTSTIDAALVVAGLRTSYPEGPEPRVVCQCGSDPRASWVEGSAVAPASPTCYVCGTALSAAVVDGGEPVVRVEVRGLTWIDGDYRPNIDTEECGWQEFLDANDEGFSVAEMVAMHRALSLEGSTVFGGGAAAAFQITRIAGAPWVPPVGWAPMDTGGGCGVYFRPFVVNGITFQYWMSTPDGYRPRSGAEVATVRLYHAYHGTTTVRLDRGVYVTVPCAEYDPADEVSDRVLYGRADRLATIPPLSPDQFEALAFTFGGGVA